MRVQRTAFTSVNAALLTLGLLFIMYQLIKIDEPELVNPVRLILPPITSVAEEPELKQIVIKPPAPEEVLAAPATPSSSKIDIPPLIEPFGWKEPNFGDDSSGRLPLPENQLVLVLGYPPEYPRRAIHGLKEGYTVVGFSVDEAGQVFNAEILDSYPAGVFDRVSLKAINKFRYKPRELGGKTVVTHNQRYKFTFKLDN